MSNTSRYGFGSLLTQGDSNAKTAKSNKAGSQWNTAIMHLSPQKGSGFGNVCASASPGCIAACLNTAGRGRFDKTQQARQNRTKLWFQDRDAFMVVLVSEIEKHIRKSIRLGLKAALRLNGTSDIIWERVTPWLFTNYPNVQFYDYTKHAARCMASYKLPANYHLTFSRSETNDDDCRRVLRSGKCNVAVVFNSRQFPSLFWNKPTYSMDETDLRFLDPNGGHVGCLYAKGKGKKDETGFVLPPGPNVRGGSASICKPVC